YIIMRDLHSFPTRRSSDLIFLCIILMSINVNSAFQTGDNEEFINAFAEDKLLRLHVIANTNSPRDQYIKRLVRERLTEYIAFLADRKSTRLNSSHVKISYA